MFTAPGPAGIRSRCTLDSEIDGRRLQVKDNVRNYLLDIDELVVGAL
jgi:hypothetical protein